MKLKLVYIVIFILFLVGFYIRAESIGVGLDHPGNLKAGNAFYHTILPTYIKEGVNVFTYPPNLAEGHDDIINKVAQHQALTIAPLIQFTGIQDWNLSVLIIVFISALSIPLMYLLIKSITKSTIIGLLSAALIAIPLNLKHWLYYTYIGIWLQSSMMTFVLASFLLAYSIHKSIKPWKVLLLSLISTTIFLLFPIALLITLPILIAILIKLIKTKEDRAKNIQLFIIPPLVAIIIVMPIYAIGYFSNESFSSFGTQAVKEILNTSHSFIKGFDGFPIILTILFALGAIQLLLNYKKYKGIILFLIYYFIIMFLLPHITPRGITVYILRMWSTLPYIVFPIAAYGLYFFIIKNIPKIKKEYILTAILIILLIFGIPQFNNLKDSLAGEHVSKEKYDALKWIQDNTAEDSTIFMLQGSYQTEAVYTKRLTYQITIENLIEKINELAENNTINITFKSGWFHVASWSKWRYKTGYLSYGAHEPLEIEQDIRDFNYVYMENLNEAVANYNEIIKGELVEKHGFEIVYDQNKFTILKNGNK